MSMNHKNIVDDIAAGMSLEEATAKEAERSRAKSRAELKDCIMFEIIGGRLWHFTDDLTEEDVREVFRSVADEVIEKRLWQHPRDWPAYERDVQKSLMDRMKGWFK